MVDECVDRDIVNVIIVVMGLMVCSFIHPNPSITVYNIIGALVCLEPGKE
jgi:hypothetical protein